MTRRVLVLLVLGALVLQTVPASRQWLRGALDFLSELDVPTSGRDAEPIKKPRVAPIELPYQDPRAPSAEAMPRASRYDELYDRLRRLRDGEDK